MDWLRAALTAGAVLMVMLAARRCGPRLAGVMAALPTITAPALGWLAHDRGAELAMSAAIASVSVCAMLSAFALAYSFAARRAGPFVAVVGGVAGAALMVIPALAAADDLRHALLLAFASCAMTCLLMRRSDARAVALRWSAHRMLCVAVATGALTALLTLVGSTLSGFATGLLASLPLISGGVVITAHMTEGRGAALDFLRGYAWGLFGKIAFGTAFALLVPQLGAMPALLLACACAVLVSTIRQPPAFVHFRPWPQSVVDSTSR